MSSPNTNVKAAVALLATCTHDRVCCRLNEVVSSQTGPALRPPWHDGQVGTPTWPFNIFQTLRLAEY
jgi:hypothetical protein